MNGTLMAKETREVSDTLVRQLNRNEKVIAQLVAKVGESRPSLIYMIGRGSSDHAGVFAKYLFETTLGIPVCHAALSLSSIYNKALHLENALVFVISQSGGSNDIIAQTEMAKQAGAIVVGLINNEDAELRHIVDFFIPLSAGPELAVAATKSYIAALSALIHIAAKLSDNVQLFDDLKTAPKRLKEELEQPSLITIDAFASLERCVVLGRGFGYAIAREMALKIKEVCAIQAEAFSSAEFSHGPFALLNNPLSILNVLIYDESKQSHEDRLAIIKSSGGALMSTLKTAPDLHPAVQCLVIMQRFYLDIESISLALGMNPDSPEGLKKVTKTI
jgi:glucosamine--fructose-6-phosphate aminotransferase (isomerizing)